jgi:glycosyltransferase involved in cell wall biosynthesis
VSELAFVVPDNLSRPTGGNRYDQSVADALARLGVRVELRTAPGDWPVATAASRAHLASQFAGPLPVLVDGLLACGAPDEVRAAVRAGGRVYVLVHMPLALDTGLSAAVASARDDLEGAALRAASAVVATSAWTAADLLRRHRLDQVAVATPGADPAPLARGSAPPMLLHLAAVTPVKNQLCLVEALALLAGEPWTARLTGSLDAAPGYVAAVRAAITRHGLDDRITLTGPITGPALDRLWDECDLLVLPSQAETWGMAVTEGLARGIPAVVSRGTGAAEALGTTPDGAVPGAVADARSPSGLAAAIGEVLGPGREHARRSAAIRRQALPGWQATARVIQHVIRPVIREAPL